MIQTSCWEGHTAKGRSEWAGSGATSSSDGTTSHFHFPGAGQQPHTSRQYSHQVSLQDWESPLTPPPPKLLPQAVRMPMYMGGRVLEDETITTGLPIIPREHDKGPPSGRLICRCLTRRVDAQLGHLVIPLRPPPQALRGLPLTPWRASLTIGAKGGRRT